MPMWVTCSIIWHSRLKAFTKFAGIMDVQNNVHELTSIDKTNQN